MKHWKWMTPVAMACALIGATSSHAATCTSARYGSFTIGSATFNNDEWGNNYHTQTICANSQTNFYITSDQTANSGVEAYGDVNYNINKSISGIKTLSSTVSQSTPSAGTWDAAYDIWNNTSSYEIMIWTNWTGNPDGCGNARPIAYTYSSAGCSNPTYTNVNIGGTTYNVFEGNNGHNVISLLRTSKTNNTTTNLLAVLQWIESKGYFGNITVGQLQYGVEVANTSGNETWTMSNYTVTSN